MGIPPSGSGIDPSDSGIDSGDDESSGGSESGGDPTGANPTAAGDEGGSDAGCRAVDLLFVIDNSGSMEDEQANLISSFPGFINAMSRGRQSHHRFHQAFHLRLRWARV